MDASSYRQKMKECREWLAAKLGYEDVPDDVWGYLEKREVSYDAIDFDLEVDWQELEREARDYMRTKRDESAVYAAPPGRSGEREAPREIAVEISESSSKRAEAFSEVAATLAANNPYAKRFRRSRLRGRLLNDQEARAFMDEQGGPYGTGTALIRLHNLAQRLTKTFNWEQGDAAWFVLTGRAPLVRPLGVKVSVNNTPMHAQRQVIKRASRNRPAHNLPAKRVRDYHASTARISVTADAWLDAGEVEQVFREVQRQVLGGDAKRRDERTLEVAKFVARRMREYGEETWRERWEAWNRKCTKEWHYKSYRGLRQTFERFVHRQYNLPNYEVRESTPYEAYREDWISKQEGEG
jgi:hypothetical protein